MKVLFVAVKWSDYVESGAWNLDTVHAMAKKTRAYYLENSYGKLDMDITVAPWLSIPVTGATASTSLIRSTADVELQKLGIMPLQYERIVYFSSGISTSRYKGLNSGRLSWVFNCMGSEYAIHATLHELGHSLGVGHPSVIKLGTRNGSVVNVPPLSVKAAGTIRSLYDPSTVMGYDAWSPHFSGPEKVALGWVTPTVHLGGDVTYSLTPLAVAGGTCYVIKVPMTTYDVSSARTYWVERREDVGSSYWFKIPSGMRGIIIRVKGDFGCYSPARIDTTPVRPGSSYSYTSNLLPGETFTDGTISIECGADGAVRIHDAGVITVPPPVVPVNPNVATLAALQPLVAGLVAGQVTQTKLDTLRTLSSAMVKDA